ncbi:MAG: asparagine synthase-related protein [Candidatus Aminicenantes bacterium]|jgi:asparagine synthase (glutamine-hydrolysing)
MSGIAGVDQPEKQRTVKRMLEKISHRGRAGRKVKSVKGSTIGMVCAEAQIHSLNRVEKKNEVVDVSGSGRLALAKVREDGVFLKRDPIGIAPLYYGENGDGVIHFASEVKALLDFCSEIKPVPPGYASNGEDLEAYYKLAKKKPSKEPPGVLAEGLKARIKKSIAGKIEQTHEVGSWLSGGLDSSSLAALARPLVKRLYTFAGGIKGSTDLKYAKAVADYLGTEHREIVVQLKDLVSVLPEVIYHLESFDALLVRSSLVNYIVAQKASEYVDAVLSGEGGDELFAGYHYLKNLEQDDLAHELIDITQRLHNTALQRVDRSASAHGTVAHVCFLDPEVLDYALRIPPEFKLHDNVEKWILRVALDGELPEKVLKRKKAKFWKGAGVEELMAGYAEQSISDKDFSEEQYLANGWTLHSKEELLYYRIFKENFGDLEDYSWMGRTKKNPVMEA